MRCSLAVAVFPFALLAANSALALDQCNVAGDPALFGQNATAAFVVKAGQGCSHGDRIQGSISETEVTTPPQHGKIDMIDKATWTYVPAAGYSGPDTFAMKASGKSFDEKAGTSMIVYRVTVQ